MAILHDATITPGKRVKGHIGKRLSDDRGDVDFYRIKPPGPGRHILRVEVTGIRNIDLMLEAYGRGIFACSSISRTSGRTSRSAKA